MFELSRRCFNNYKFLRHLNETFRLITYEEHHLWIEKELLRKSNAKVNNNCQLSKSFKPML